MSAHMVTNATSSSSEDKVENQRLLDAVWHQNLGEEATSRQTQQDMSAESSRTRQIKRPSVREMINQESHDQFNEDHKNVKATPEFRNFVAKKLASVLDGKLKMTLSKKQKALNNENAEENEEDSFRLFSSSGCAPNLDTPEPAPLVKRKRPRIGRNTKKLSLANNDQDSSDSDVQDQRLAEAAISGYQILSFAAFSTLSGRTAEEVKCSRSDTVSAPPHEISKRTRPDGALNKSKVEIKERVLSEVGSSKEVVKKKKKKKKKHTNASNGDDHEKVNVGKCQAGAVSSSELSAEKDQEVDFSHVDNSSRTKQKKKTKKCKPGKDFEQSVEDEYSTAGSGKHILDEKVNSYSEEAVDNRRRKKKKKRKEEFR